MFPFLSYLFLSAVSRYLKCSLYALQPLYEFRLVGLHALPYLTSGAVAVGTLLLGGVAVEPLVPAVL
jgi:hypothetical protein